MTIDGVEHGLGRRDVVLAGSVAGIGLRRPLPVPTRNRRNEATYEILAAPISAWRDEWSIGSLSRAQEELP